MTRPGDRVFAILADAARLTDDELLELHRVLSITAERIAEVAPEQRRPYLERMQRPIAVRGDAAEQRATVTAWQGRLRVVR